MNILIINPGNFSKENFTEHLGILSLMSYLNSNGFKVDVLDLAIEAFSNEEVVNEIIQINPTIIGFSLLDETKFRGFELIKNLKTINYTGKIVVGGYFPTFSSYEILRDFPEIDFVIRGEGELTLEQLMQKEIRKANIKLKDIAGLSYRENTKIIENPSRPLIKDLDILPPINRKYANKVLLNKTPLRVYATRGCWGKCTFCNIIDFYGQSNGKRWRRRSAKNIVDELEHLHKTYQTNHIIFNDDQFLLKGKPGLAISREFAEEIRNRNLNIKFDLMCRADTVNVQVMSTLKQVGLNQVFLGLESFDENQLKRYQKNISFRQNLKAIITLYNLKIDVIASVILADAFTTFSDLVKQFITLFELRRRYFNSKNCKISVNKKLEIYKGSVVYEQYKSKGLLIKDHYMYGCDFKLKFWTDVRIKILDLEEAIYNSLFGSENIFKRILNKTQIVYYKLFSQQPVENSL